MAKTLVGVFDDAVSAQNAATELQTLGVPQNQLRIMDNSDAARSSSSSVDDRSWGEKISSWFSSLFDDENDRAYAHHYAEAWRRGHYVLIADVESKQVDDAVAILNRYGTVDVNQRAEEWRATGYTGRFDSTARPYTAEQRAAEVGTYRTRQAAPTAGTNATAGDTAIPVVQEELAVGKRVVQRGGVRIHSYVEERPAAEVIRLREERVNIQRRTANRPADAADLAFQERTVDVTASAEEPIVEKRARVVEEVVVGKSVEERDQTVQDNLRRKDVRIEQLPPRDAPASQR